jgi:hypothetical protein
MPAFSLSACDKKYFVHPTELVMEFGYYSAAGWWTINMRILASLLVVSAVAAFPCSAQTVLKSEPLALAPYEVAYVQDYSCPAGKVLKVTGAIRGLHRKRICVSFSSEQEQASLAVATP